MKKDEIIKLSHGQKATLFRGDDSQLKNTYIVRLENGELIVVDRKTLTLAESLGETKSKHSIASK